ncbi:hypothetical protein NFS12_004527 [Salmonella enterica]|nr:hypothetical protein [Salmonella enterica]HBM0000392.1 hypothetical protein [Salmonella enterica subsp. enterica serovar Kodjovi]HCM8913926.1 hypothetical protein [Salmonella enterica subsp. enterica serovar Paratyphi B]
MIPSGNISAPEEFSHQSRTTDPERKKQLEDQIALWVYRKKRPVTAVDIAGYFNLHIHTTRLLVHAIMRRTDGTLCMLEGRYVRDPVSKRTRQVKYFSVLSLPDALTHSRNERNGRR